MRPQNHYRSVLFARVDSNANMLNEMVQLEASLKEPSPPCRNPSPIPFYRKCNNNQERRIRGDSFEGNNAGISCIELGEFETTVMAMTPNATKFSNTTEDDKTKLSVRKINSDNNNENKSVIVKNGDGRISDTTVTTTGLVSVTSGSAFNDTIDTI